LGLGSQLSSCFGPNGAAGRGAQVKRERPGMRGKTTNQTTRNRTKNPKPSTHPLYTSHRTITILAVKIAEEKSKGKKQKAKGKNAKTTVFGDPHSKIEYGLTVVNLRRHF
jgi:hypothetical protein